MGALHPRQNELVRRLARIASFSGGMASTKLGAVHSRHVPAFKRDPGRGAANFAEASICPPQKADSPAKREV